MKIILSLILLLLMWVTIPPSHAIDLTSFRGKAAVERCYEWPDDPHHRRTLIKYRVPSKDQFGFVHRLVEGWERNWTDSGGDHPTLLYGAAVLFPINGEYDLVQMRLTRSFPGSNVDNDVWYFDDHAGHVSAQYPEVDCAAPWPIVQTAAKSARPAGNLFGAIPE